MLGDNHNLTRVICERLPDGPMKHTQRTFKDVGAALQWQARGCSDVMVRDESGDVLCGSRRITHTIRFLEGVEASAVAGRLGVLCEEPS